MKKLLKKKLALLAIVLCLMAATLGMSAYVSSGEITCDGGIICNNISQGINNICEPDPKG